MNKRVYPESVAMIAVGLDEDPVEFFRKLMKGVKARRRLRALRRQMRRPAGSWNSLGELRDCCSAPQPQ